MIRSLIGVQLRTMLATLNLHGKGGAKPSRLTRLFAVVIAAYVAFALFQLFSVTMDALCAPLLGMDLGWLYFSLAGIMAMAIAVISSLFMAQSMLYEAKDNEFLLSLPISPTTILFSRMFGLYVQNFLFGGIVWLATVVSYGRCVTISALSLVFCVSLLFLLPLLSLALTCILAWAVASLTSRMRSKTLFTMILSLGFLGAYFYLFSQADQLLQQIILASASIGASVRTAFYPLYQMGLAAEGDPLAFLIFAVIVLGLFAVVYVALSRSFIRIVTTKKAAAKVHYREEALRVQSVGRALLGKELRRFTSSAVYMLNCGLGALILVGGSIFLAVEEAGGTPPLSIVEQVPVIARYLPLATCAMICAITAVDVVSAPSVSLEGNNLWVVQSLPVDGRQVLLAKLRLHLLVNIPAAVFAAVVLDVLLMPNLLVATLAVLVPCVYVVFCGELGLLLNLRLPNLDWTSEAVAVKQSASVLAAVFSNIGVVVLFGALFYVSSDLLSEEGFLFITMSALLVMSAVLWRVLMRWGVHTLAYLD